MAARPSFEAVGPGGQSAKPEANYSAGLSSIFGSCGLLACREDTGFIPSASRIALLRRFRASSRADPPVTTLEVCMVRSLLGKLNS